MKEGSLEYTASSGANPYTARVPFVVFRSALSNLTPPLRNPYANSRIPSENEAQAMLISILELEREPLVFELSIAAGAIDYGTETIQREPLTVEGRADLIEETHGPRTVIHDIRVQGDYSGEFEIACARCLAPVRKRLGGHFDVLYRPLGADQGATERSITASETEIGYYQESGLMLEDVLREQVLLSLPARTLCREDCKGLCPHCGRDLNTEQCVCETALADPRWSALSDIAGRLKK